MCGSTVVPGVAAVKLWSGRAAGARVASRDSSGQEQAEQVTRGAEATGAERHGAQPYRDRLLAGMAELCAASPRAREPAVRDQLGAVFLQVLGRADADTRRRFAARTAGAAWMAPALAAHLAQDADFAVAQPVIAASPMLEEAVLAQLAEHGPAEHRAEVAGRAGLPSAVARLILAGGDPLALQALSANADLPPGALDRLVEASHALPSLRAVLARRRDLTLDLARRLAGWSGGALAEELGARFDLATSPAPSEADPEEEAQSDARLLHKLRAAGQLRPGYLLRTLRDGRLRLFGGALSLLAGFGPGEVERALNSDRPDLLALACAAAGLDRSVFPTLLELVRSLNGGAPRGGGDEALAGALLVADRAAAADAFRAGLAGL